MSFCFCFFFLRDKRRLFCFCSSRGFASYRLQNSRGFFPQNRFSLALESHTREVREPHTPVRRVRREKKGVFRQSRSPFSPSLLASPQTSFGVRLSRIHKWMRDKRTPRDVCGEAKVKQNFAYYAGNVNNKLCSSAWILLVKKEHKQLLFFSFFFRPMKLLSL